MNPISVTLNQLQAADPCPEGTSRITKFFGKKLGKTEPDDEPFPISTILDAYGGPNRVYHASWCFRCLHEDDWFRIGLFVAALAEANLPAYQAFREGDDVSHCIMATRYYAMRRFSLLDTAAYANWTYKSAELATYAGYPEAADSARSANKAMAWAIANDATEFEQIWDDTGRIPGDLDVQVDLFKEYFDTPLSFEDYLIKFNIE